MTGRLYYTEQGWVIEHRLSQKNPIGQVSWVEKLPLHPEDALYCMSADEGKEFDFTIVEDAIDSSGLMFNHFFGDTQEVSKKYAKLIQVTY